MDLGIAAGVVIGLFALTVVYAIIRVAWRLRQGDIEAAGRDSDTFRHDKR